MSCAAALQKSRLASPWGANLWQGSNGNRRETPAKPYHACGNPKRIEHPETQKPKQTRTPPFPAEPKPTSSCVCSSETLHAAAASAGIVLHQVIAMMALALATNFMELSYVLTQARHENSMKLACQKLHRMHGASLCTASRLGPPHSNIHHLRKGPRISQAPYNGFSCPFRSSHAVHRARTQVSIR